MRETRGNGALIAVNELRTHRSDLSERREGSLIRQMMAGTELIICHYGFRNTRFTHLLPVECLNK